jgi:hypothetical protein
MSNVELDAGPFSRWRPRLRLDERRREDNYSDRVGRIGRRQAGLPDLH